MSNQECDLCGKLFKDGSEVRAVILTKFKSLKSNRVYALEKPTECLGIMHYPDCYEDSSNG